MNRSLVILFFCLFVVMTGYGLTLPVLPFYIERMASTNNASTAQAAFQVGLLTGIFSLMQFLFAPLWGRWSDITGRRPLFLIGLTGFSFSMLLFALGTSLGVLYIARIIGGALSAAILPIAGAFVADMTSDEQRARGMAWLGTATSLGVVLGPALGAFLSKWHSLSAQNFGYFRIDGFSIPFFSASVLALIALGAAILWFPESLPQSQRNIRISEQRPVNTANKAKTSGISRWLGPLLALAFLNYFALAVFEGTFALHAKVLIGFGSFEMGWIFMACGLVMAVGQSTLTPLLINHFGEQRLLPLGFVMMGGGLGLLMVGSQITSILLFVALLALGVAFITPTLASMASKWAGPKVGKALGQMTAANSLGQAAGPVLGGIMISRRIHSPYLITSVLLGLAALYCLLFHSRNR